jgi:hypothetical protein
MRIGAGFILLALLFLLVSCSACPPVQAGLLPDHGSKTFISRNYGISLKYPDDWTIGSEKFIRTDPMGNEYRILRLTHVNTTTGLVLAITVSREDIDPALLPANFTGSEECGYFWVDDNPNRTYIEGYYPTSLGGVKARRSMSFLEFPGNQTVETLYDVCRSYRSGRNVYTWFFWSVPADNFFTVQPGVRDVLDSVRLFEPMGLFSVDGILDRASLEFPEHEEDVYDTFTNPEFGLSFQYPRGWRVAASDSDAENYPRMKKGLLTFTHLPDDISLAIDMVRYDFIDSYQKTQPFMNETILCAFDCPECRLRYEFDMVSGYWICNATRFLVKNDRTYVEEMFVICPVRTVRSQSGYRVTYSVPLENWERVQHFMHGFVTSLQISAPS